MSITRVFASGFKGGDFDQPLGKHTLILGPNGAGKSSRTEALMLAVNGAIPGGPKTNPDIFAAFCDGDEMEVGFEMNGYIFTRAYSRNKDTITQAYRVNKKKVTKDFFLQSLGQQGRPRVIDLKDFIDLSDQKKIDAVLNLFPPAEDVSKVASELDKAKLSLNDAVAKLKAQENVCASLKTQRATMQLPATTLSAVTEEIANIEGILAKAQTDLAEVQKQEAVEAERKRAEEKAKADAERKEKEDAEKKAKEAAAPPAPEPKKLVIVDDRAPAAALASKISLAATPIAPLSETAAASILAIMDAMELSGCGVCAAKLVAKRELKKYQGGTHGQAAIG